MVRESWASAEERETVRSICRLLLFLDAAEREVLEVELGILRFSWKSWVMPVLLEVSVQ